MVLGESQQLPPNRLFQLVVDPLIGMWGSTLESISVPER
jgi:hypothetical protein